MIMTLEADVHRCEVQKYTTGTDTSGQCMLMLPVVNCSDVDGTFLFITYLRMTPTGVGRIHGII